MRMRHGDTLRLCLISIACSIWSMMHHGNLLVLNYPQHISHVDESVEEHGTDDLQILNAHSANDNQTTAIETVLIIATVPYSADHAMALWTHLECVTDGIDTVLISAPDTDWSRKIVTAIIEQFTELSSNTGFHLEAAFYTNNRYDVGLWCDALSMHFGFNGNHFSNKDRTYAIFLINDSSVSLRKYRALTDRIVTAAQTEQLQQIITTKDGDNKKINIKLVSLNGNLIEPGITKNYWVESVYRGFTPNAVSTFFQHSCTPDAMRACVGKVDNARKQCIVNRYEMSLADSFLPSEVDAMYPTYLPTEWDASEWMEKNGGIGGRYVYSCLIIYYQIILAGSSSNNFSHPPSPLHGTMHFHFRSVINGLMVGDTTLT